MRCLLISLIGFLTAVQALNATAQDQPSFTVTAKVVNDQGDPVDYATVQMRDQKDSTRFFGTITDENGKFELTVPHGDYSLRITFLGYQEYNQDLTVSAKTDLGKLEMSTSTVDLKEVVVTANLITREADRYVINLADTPLAIGRDGKEALMLAPGVWVSNRGEISVNGRTGTRVMVNERLLQETGEDLLAYLQSLRAEDILKIEVIPYAGVEYDASMTSGIVKITLRKQRNDGMEGSVSLRYSHSLDRSNIWSVAPATSIKFRHNKLSLYTDFTVDRSLTGYTTEGTNSFDTKGTSEQYSTGVNGGRGTSERLRIGGVYDITPTQSVGLEVNYSNYPNQSSTDGAMTINNNGNITNIASKYGFLTSNQRVSVSANYFRNLDTLGSIFKLMFDYNNSQKDDYNDYNSTYTGFMTFDTTYRSDVGTGNNLYTINADFDIHVGKVSKIATGLKYSYNDMKYNRLYEYFKNNLWQTINDLSGNDRYTENISAVYFRYTTRFRNNFSLALGLRGEYTYAVPSTNSTMVADKQNYFSLFPSFNLSMPLNEKQSQMFVLSYNRRIRRPSFWTLVPVRTPISETSYQVGNPKLQPVFANDINFSWIFGRKYSLNLGVQIRKDDIAQVMERASDNSDIIVFMFKNISNSTQWYANLSLPAQITPWWGMTTNLTGFNMRNTIQDGEKNFRSGIQANMNNTFTVAKKWYIDLSGFYMSKFEFGNMTIDPMYMVNLSFKRSFWKNRLTASIFVNDIFNTGLQKVTSSNNGATTRTVVCNMLRQAGFSIRYNFKADKQQKYKRVESGAAEETSRLNAQ